MNIASIISTSLLVLLLIQHGDLLVPVMSMSSSTRVAASAPSPAATQNDSVPLVSKKIRWTKVVPGAKFEVVIVNKFVGNIPMESHCYSKNDDMYFGLYDDGTYKWEFKMNFWKTTNFFCKFRWGHTHDDAHSVFNKRLAEECELDEYPYSCIWFINEEGWWLASDYKEPRKIRKVYEWPYGG